MLLSALYVKGHVILVGTVINESEILPEAYRILFRAVEPVVLRSTFTGVLLEFAEAFVTGPSPSFILKDPEIKYEALTVLAYICTV